MAEKLTVYTLDEVAERLARYAECARNYAQGDDWFAGKALAYEVAHAEITALVDSARRNAADDIASGNVWPVEA